MVKGPLALEIIFPSAADLEAEANKDLITAPQMFRNKEEGAEGTAAAAAAATETSPEVKAETALCALSGPEMNVNSPQREQRMNDYVLPT